MTRIYSVGAFVVELLPRARSCKVILSVFVLFPSREAVFSESNLIGTAFTWHCTIMHYVNVTYNSAYQGFVLKWPFLLGSLEKMGALNWAKVVHEHQGWRLISCIWLHAGLVHLIVNMLSLLFIGIRLEQQFGFCKLLVCNCWFIMSLLPRYINLFRFEHLDRILDHLLFCNINLCLDDVLYVLTLKHC